MITRLVTLLISLLITICTNAQVGIGISTPNANAKLELVSTNQGFLVPRVNLTSKTQDLNADNDNNVNNQPIGLLVYNTGSVLVKGFCYWTGTEWRNLVNASAELATATLNCSAATIDPQQQILNPNAITAGTTMTVPYTLGNGGNFAGVTLQSTGNSNVTATISNGKLNFGSGLLVFNISGIPIASQNSPTGISFDLTPFKTANPGITLSPTNGVVIIGAQTQAKITTVTVIDSLSPALDGTGANQVMIITQDGKYALRVYLNQGNQIQYASVQIKNLAYSQGKNILWNHIGSYGSYNVTSDCGGIFSVPYNNWVGGSGNSGGYNVSWADMGIFQASNGGPEYRYYAWMTHGANEKTAYIATIMAGTADGNITSTDASKMKVFIKIEQIVAP